MKVHITPEAINALKKERMEKGVSSYRILTGCASCGGLSFALLKDKRVNKEDLTERHQGIQLIYTKDVAEVLDQAKLDHHTDEYGDHFIMESSYGSSVCWL